MKHTITLLLAFLIIFSSNADGNKPLWRDIQKNEKPDIISATYRVVSLDFEALKNHLNAAPWENLNAPFSSTFELEIPLPDGGFETFLIERTKLMENDLAAKYPEIKTFSGYSKKDGRRRIVLDHTYQGFHAVVRYPGDAIFIDPFNKGNKEEYVVYKKSEFAKVNSPKMTEIEPLQNEDEEYDTSLSSPQKKGTGSQLKTYRMAISATGEYTQYHGGTKALALSAIMTTLSRVTGVYENDLAIRMVLVNNNDLIIYTNSSTDPFTNYNAGSDLSKNQEVCDSNIGTANYDVGHVVGTGGGGLASLGVPCSNTRKAQGVTGSDSPINDPFDIDYVAHEVGHQFGANHTFNGTGGSCDGNRVSSSAYEPGSGSTIMSYAGICGSQNLQNNSDDIFHNGSYNEITNYVTVGNGKNCPVITSTGNNPPVVDADQYLGTSTITIPMKTPFELVGSATDPDNDTTLTYLWEQYDRGPEGGPYSPSGDAPIFRDWYPTASPMRIFPRIQNLLNNNFVIGERLPEYDRNMTFRLTVRDNKNAGGGVEYDTYYFQATGEAGPFLVTSPNLATDVWMAGTHELISWDVANTNLYPVEAEKVDIFLSLDGGYTYPITLAENVPNDGNHVVMVPANLAGETQARVKVKGYKNIFFDISNKNFSIQSKTGTGYEVITNKLKDSICANSETITYEIYSSLLSSLNGNITLSVSGDPALTYSLSSTSISAPDTAFLTVTSPALLSDSGLYVFTINATDGTNNQSIELQLAVCTNSPAALSETFKSQFNIFPNPAQDVIHIQLQNNTSYNAEMIDATGRTVKYVSGLNGNASISVNELSKGIYQLKIYDQQNVGIFKIVVR